MGFLDGISGSAATSMLLPTQGSLLRFIPEPKSRVANTFQNVLSGAAGLMSEFAPEMAGLPDQLVTLLNQQVEIQMQMQTISMISNIAKSEQETHMAAIRNMRVD